MRKITLLSLLLFSFGFGISQNIIPFPAKILNPDKKFNLQEIKGIYVEDKNLMPVAEVFNIFLSKTKGLYVLPIVKNKQNALILSLDTKFKEEHYSIEPLYANSIKIAGRKSGVFYGLMTILQSMSAKDNSVTKIEDEPAFTWRGMHLDVSRHFFDKEFIKKYIDVLAIHKMNVFHWHLTDDQGWRIEIKQFPLLTEIGSKRTESVVEKNFNPYQGDGKPVEGFYTQEDIKEIVLYASQRNVTIVPEIEMPGHAMAALAAYPQFSCRKEPLKVMTTWGVSDDVFCTNDSTLDFLKKVLDEVITLFPGKYIHIGGDEVPKTRWLHCETCQQKMRDQNLRNENELQSYFIKQMDAYLTAKGKSTIGWDEILEGGLAPNAAIMSWRGEEGGIEAAKQNHYVVMTPGSHCYFDHYQGNKQTEPLAIGGFTTVEKVYGYNPQPSNLNESQKKYILGAQGNVWTEYMQTSKHVEYMALPRLCALSEALWNGKNKPGYLNFVNRLENHFSFLDRYNVNYSKSIYDVSIKHEATGGVVFAKIESPFTKGKIYYSNDGTDPSVNSQVYSKRIFLNKSQTIKAQYFENNTPVGNINTQVFEIHQGVNKKITCDIPPYKNKTNLLLDAHIGLLPKNLDEWVAWKDKFPSLVVDMHIPTNIKNINVYVIQEPENDNYLPSDIEVLTSSDGINFKHLTYLNKEEIEYTYDNYGMININTSVKTRYIKLAMSKEGLELKSDTKPWLLISEIVIN